MAYVQVQTTVAAEIADTIFSCVNDDHETNVSADRCAELAVEILDLVLGVFRPALTPLTLDTWIAFRNGDSNA
jgi:hypothetical protein